jgi:pilus assembly protein CpaC
MITNSSILHRSLLLAATAAFAFGATASTAAPAKRKAPAARSSGQSVRTAQLPAGTQRPTSEVLLSVGEGQLVNLPTNVSDVWTSNPGAADVYVNSARQIYVFGKDFGEATIFATSASGQVVYATNVRVSQNITTIDRVLKLAMPDANIAVTNVGQLAILTGTVRSPEDAEHAERLVKAYLNPGIDTSSGSTPLKILVASRLRTATPLQVNLHVKIAEVNRSLSKEIGVNLMSRDTTNGFQFGIAQGRNFGTIGTADISTLPRLDASSVFGLPAGSLSLPFDTRTGQFVTAGTAFNLSNLGLGAGKTAIGLAGKLFGLDVATALDLAETEGLLTTLAEPNLTALSGETASFLAGGEFPIPISQGQGEVTVEYKQYGVSLAFTPVVLDNGRISMRVRPEVSELTSQGTVRLNGFDIPGVSTRRAETTVELGSGQSFMIAGLMNNTHSNIIDRTPGAGNVPVLGALFRSTRFRKNETELMIIVTPYLVEPVSANQIVLPTDGYKAATDIQRVLLGKTMGSDGGPRPVPTMEPSARAIRPGLEGAMAPAADPTSRRAERKQPKRSTKPSKVAVAPGFSAN